MDKLVNYSIRNQINAGEGEMEWGVSWMTNEGCKLIPVPHDLEGNYINELVAMTNYVQAQGLETWIVVRWVDCAGWTPWQLVG